MNDNVDQPIPPTVIAPREEVKQTDVHQQVMALLSVWDAAKSLVPIAANPLTTALDIPALQSLNPEALLGIIDACLNMALPGSPLYARGAGMLSLTFPDGKIAPAVALELFPGKRVIFTMSRETAESFEKLLKAAIDEHFGRIIKP